MFSYFVYCGYEFGIGCVVFRIIVFVFVFLCGFCYLVRIFFVVYVFVFVSFFLEIFVLVFFVLVGFYFLVSIGVVFFGRFFLFVVLCFVCGREVGGLFCVKGFGVLG